MTASAHDRFPSMTPAYAGGMSAETAGEPPERNLRAIRDALVVPQDVYGFDVGLDEVLAEVRETLDLTKLHAFVHTWWLIACDNVTDPEGRVEMYERADRIQETAARGEPLPRSGTTWQRLFAERGIEVDL